MQVKKFYFPHFNEFYALNQSHKYEWKVEDSVGIFTGVVGVSCWSRNGNIYTIKAHVTEKYSGHEILYHSYFDWNPYGDLSEFRAWYEKATSELNTMFEKYLLETYTEN